MSTAALIKYGVIGVGLYALYKWLAPNGKLPGTCFLTTAACNVASGIANTLVNWGAIGCNISLNGNVQFPNGSQVALNALPVGSDCGGNVYVQYSGGVYQLNSGGSNSCGNWTATQVS